MANTFQSTGIILKEYNYAEADKLFIVFSKSKGKITCTAQGVRRAKSRMRGYLQPFSYSTLHLHQGKTMYKVIGGEIINSFPNIKNDLLLYCYANYMAEILINILPSDEANEKAFILIASIFHLLGTMSPSQLSSIFILRLLRHTGFLPELFKCVKCGKPVEDSIYFNDLDSGCVCCLCLDSNCYNRSISFGMLKVMRRFLTTDLEVIGRLKVSLKDQLEIEEFLNDYLETIVEKKINSRKLIKELCGFDKLIK